MAFSLVELLIVLALLGIAFFPLLETVTNGLRAGQSVDQSGQALRIAEQKIEAIRGTAFSAIASEQKGAVTGASSFQRQVVVSNTSATLKDVSVLVTWGGQGSGESVSLQTYVSSYEAVSP